MIKEVIENIRKSHCDLCLRKKVLLIVSISILISMLLSIAVAGLMTKRRFEENTKDRFAFTSSLVKINIQRFFQDIASNFERFSDDIEINRDTIASLNAFKPRRSNFYKLFYLLNDFAAQYNIEQISVHFASLNSEGKYQLYGVALPKEDHVFSFSTKKDENGKGLAEISRDQFGFFSLKGGGVDNYDFKFPTEAKGADLSFDYLKTADGFYIDINYPIINKFIGLKTPLEEMDTGFTYLGMTYGVIRAFLRVPPTFLDKLEKETGVNLNVFSNSGEHLLGDIPLRKTELAKLKKKVLFPLNVDGKSYLNFLRDLRIGKEKNPGLILMSILESTLLNELIYTVVVLFLVIITFSCIAILVASDFLQRSLVQPLLATITVVKGISEGDREKVVNVKGNDEIGILGNSINKMQKDLNQAFATIEHQNHTLELKVNQRTKELHQRTNDIEAMLQNIPQGVFTLIEEGMIHHEYSKYLNLILDKDEIANKNIMDVLFENSDLGDDKKNQIDSVIKLSVGESPATYLFNVAILPSVISYISDKGIKKILELSWNHIVDKDLDIVSKILVTVKDVTKLKDLEEKSQKQRAELLMIGQIINLSEQNFHKIMMQAHDVVAMNRYVIKNTDSYDEKRMEELLRNMHTLKGSARAFGLTFIADEAHACENSYDQLRVMTEKVWEKDLLLKDLQSVDDSINTYKSIHDKKLKKSSSLGDSMLISKKIYSDIKKVIDDTNWEWVPSAKESMFALKNLLDNIGTTPFEESFHGILKALPDLAKDLNKLAPKVIIDGEGIYLNEIEEMFLKDIFIHLFRNSVYHGIETESVRREKGKAGFGVIRIIARKRKEGLEICYFDDGRGLDIEKISLIAKDRGILSEVGNVADEEIAKLIFISGLTTASHVDMTAGRGAGLDAVKQKVAQMGAVIRLKLIDNELSEDNLRPFEYIIQMPRQKQDKVV